MKWLRIFPPLSHGWCRKKIVPHTASGGPGFEFCVVSTGAIISLGRHEPFEARGQETANNWTRTKQWKSSTRSAPPCSWEKEISNFCHSCQLVPWKTAKSCVQWYCGTLKAALWMSPRLPLRYFWNFANNFLGPHATFVPSHEDHKCLQHIRSKVGTEERTQDL